MQNKTNQLAHINEYELEIEGRIIDIITKKSTYPEYLSFMRFLGKNGKNYKILIITNNTYLQSLCNSKKGCECIIRIKSYKSLSKTRYKLLDIIEKNHKKTEKNYSTAQKHSMITKYRQIVCS